MLLLARCIELSRLAIIEVPVGPSPQIAVYFNPSFFFWFSASKAYPQSSATVNCGILILVHRYPLLLTLSFLQPKVLAVGCNDLGYFISFHSSGRQVVQGDLLLKMDSPHQFRSSCTVWGWQNCYDLEISFITEQYGTRSD